MARTATIRVALLCASLLYWAGSVGAAEPSQDGSQDEKPATLEWQAEYGKAQELAEARGKMLLIYFYDSKRPQLTEAFETQVLADPNITTRLADWVCLKLPIDATITSGGQPQMVLKHPAFAEMVGQPGLAVIDYVHRDKPYFGLVVGEFPFLDGRTYTPRETAILLDLPPGTLTQRMLIYAVRTHPDHPASTSGRFDPFLANQAESHSRFQALLRLQGHHNWESRFHLINGRLPFGLLASEVCAESWPGQCLLQAAIECVHSWRLSAGHWSAVGSAQQVYGYDMKRGNNGIWYATGIFGRR